MAINADLDAVIAALPTFATNQSTTRLVARMDAIVAAGAAAQAALAEANRATIVAAINAANIPE